MDKYEISIWEDYSDETSSGKKFLNERKIAVIGSDTMIAQARALEPNLIEEINGTHTFTFKMYYTYTDNQTGEKYENPFGKYLINERKVKVFWKDQWYDLVIKKCQEDTSKKSITYTCTDLFINELSKQGYSLEFDTELQNNIGTAGELATSVLEGSTWQYDEEHGTPIIQKTEGPVYEVNTINSFLAIKQNNTGNSNVTIPAGKKVLVFYDSIVSILESGGTNIPTQFLYAPEGYKTDINDALVTNGDCYQVSLNWGKSGGTLTGSNNFGPVFTINLNNGVSENYRAARLVRSQKTEYDPLLDRYVLLCKDTSGNEIYEIATTEYSNPVTVINLVANPTEFTSTQGWIGQVGEVEEFGVFPKFDNTTDISTYDAKSYLHVGTKSNTEASYIYNAGIQSNISYFSPTDTEIREGKIGGIQKNEKYIFRIKGKYGNSKKEFVDYDIGVTTIFDCNLYEYDEDFKPKSNTNIFNTKYVSKNNGWIEYELTCKKSISAKKISKYGLFIKVSPFTNSLGSLYNNYWIEDVQFFKYQEGKKSYDETAVVERMNPGEISLQSIVKPVYKYYKKDNTATKADDLTYLYVGETESSTYTPVYNNYEKIGTITGKESNRFNLLQSIAETFQAWVKFRIDHEDNGAIKFIDGVPQKFVYFVQEIGEDTGISFEYGIDLKTISRTIDSDKLATKIIVKANNNEFAKQGFCSIARSDWNRSKENFILNLDYYTQQNLLDKETLNRDLYSTQDGYIGYYYWLYKYNTEYDGLSDTLAAKHLDLVKLESEQKTYQEYLLAAQQQKEIIESDLENLAGVSSWAAAEEYARSHKDNDKVQSLLNARGVTKGQITKYGASLGDVNASLTTLKDYIETTEKRQQTLLDLIANKHKEFNDKYSLYLMEGTWQDENYVDDNEYYLDGLNVAYTSSRPQLSYNINVLRLSSLDEYSSKVFNLGDICYMQDREFFGYLSDKITPYKEKILVSKISSFFDQPEKDVLTIQNYKTRFDDLFQRIAATTQSLQYSEGSFARAAGIINPDKTLSFAALQDTFDQNYDLILNSSNQDVTWDDTGITVTNKFNSADKTKIIAGGIFVTNDGGETWKNAVRGDGISTDLLTAGRVNTSEIYIYDGNAPSFRWDSDGLTAYSYDDSTGAVNFGKFVRHDKYGIYGYDDSSLPLEKKGDFIPQSEADIWDNSKFGLTWKGFFLKSGSDDSTSFEISTDNDLVIKTKDEKGTVVKRVQIGRLDGSTDNYGFELRNNSDKIVFKVDGTSAEIAGWTMNNNSIYKTVGNNTIGLFSDGEKKTIQGVEQKYYIIAGNNFGVASNGKIYASGGKIAGWNLTEDKLYIGEKGDPATDKQYKRYVALNSDGTLEGQGHDANTDNFNWSIGPDGFVFKSTKVIDNNNTKCEIVLGPTTITNKEIIADKGTIGGCGFSSGGISGGSYTLSSEGLNLDGKLLKPHTITYVSALETATFTPITNTTATSINVSITIDGKPYSGTGTIPAHTYVTAGTVVVTGGTRTITTLSNADIGTGDDTSTGSNKS